MPPPLRRSQTSEHLTRLEGLLDEFSNADGLDPKRRERLQADIRAEARAQGLEADLGLEATDCPFEAITWVVNAVRGWLASSQLTVAESAFGAGAIALSLLLVFGWIYE